MLGDTIPRGSIYVVSIEKAATWMRPQSADLFLRTKFNALKSSSFLNDLISDGICDLRVV